MSTNFYSRMEGARLLSLPPPSLGPLFPANIARTSRNLYIDAPSVQMVRMLRLVRLIRLLKLLKTDEYIEQLENHVRASPARTPQHARAYSSPSYFFSRRF